MLDVFITLSPGRRNEFIDSQKAKVRIAVHPIMDVKKHRNFTLELLERAYRLREFTRDCLKNPKYAEYRPLFTTQDEWTTVKYVMEVLRPFRYWTLWMSKTHTVTLHHVITVYNDMFDHMDGAMQALAKKKTPWSEDLFFAVKLARQKFTIFHAEVTPTMGTILISTHILDPVRKLRSFRKWDKGMDINPEDETSYTAQYQESFPKYVEDEYCAKHGRMPVNKLEMVRSSNLVPSVRASWSYQSSLDPYDLSTNDEEYLKPNNVTKTTPGLSDRAARLLTAARLYLNSPPDAAKNWGQINPNLNDYHSDPMVIGSTFWIPDITDWWPQQEETHTQSTPISPIWHATYSLSYHMVSEWGPVFPLEKMLSAGGSQKPQAGPFVKRSL